MRKFEISFHRHGSENINTVSVTTETSDVIKTDSTSIKAGEATVRFDGVITIIREVTETAPAAAESAPTKATQVEEFSEANSHEEVETGRKSKK